MGTAVLAGPELPVVGRETEIDALRDIVDRVVLARGELLVIDGEPGVGKTRLCHEALALAARRGFTVGAGAGRPPGPHAAYGVWLEALGPLLRALPASDRARVVHGLPDLGRLFADLDLPPPPTARERGLERARLFEAVAKLLARLAARRPVALFLDDLHWADVASVELLGYVARGVPDTAVLLLSACRPLGREPVDAALRALPTAIAPGSAARCWHLEGLDRDELAVLLAGLLDGTPPRPLVNAVARHAAGLPLFAVVLVQYLQTAGLLYRRGRGEWMLAHGVPVPPTLRDAVAARLDQLSAAELDLLRVVALAGDAATHEIVTAVPQRSETELFHAVLSLLSRDLLGKESVAGRLRYRLAHPYYAEMACDLVPPDRLRALHIGLARALDLLGVPDRGVLARQYRAAGELADPDQALRACHAAGEEALRRQGGDVAVDHLAAALDLAHRQGRTDLLPRLTEQLAIGYDIAGRVVDALSAWRDAAAAWRDAGEPAGVVRCLRRWALAAHDHGDPEGAARAVAEAERLLGPHAPAEELIRLAETRVVLASRRPGPAAGLVIDERRLLDLADRQGSARARTVAAVARMSRQLTHGGYAEARRAADQVLPLTPQSGDPALTVLFHLPLFLLELTLSGAPAAIALAEQALDEARRDGVPALEAGPRFCAYLGYFLAGEWEPAWDTAGQLVATGHRTGEVRQVALGSAGRALIAGHQGRHRVAAELLAEARAVGGHRLDPEVRETVDLVDAVLALHAGDTEAALATAEQLGAAPTRYPPFILALLGEAQVLRGAHTAALATAEKLLALEPTAPFLNGHAARLRGLVRTAWGDRTEAADAHAQAVAAFDELGMPVEAARSRVDWARACRPDEPVVAEARRALDVARRVNARSLADRARALLRELGARPAAPRSRPVPAFTARELEVSRLVAAGLSNAEIAERLYLSRRTVTTHLQHVYARLGLSSRTALTRYLAERNLLGEP
ncbi:LuxR family transcriptional regulator [Longimycelium tulufanense]|uniref:LuxR family transcriptional regulator n=1 Tax=Longimycelium tulufanense TaxID=907463 RepID=A0A8J3CIH9_9PSEU|nr:AAA family ATPase [Longimycelium tulufanense]GGM71886.1 LuxR family transcriptional regulator [Longimycelium tulufanense]